MVAGLRTYHVIDILASDVIRRVYFQAELRAPFGYPCL